MYSVSANIISLSIAVISSFFIPKALSINSYGYFQLYLFYISYCGFFHFGWTSGLYLEKAGVDYKELNQNNEIASQFWLLILLDIIYVILFALLARRFSDSERKLIISLIGINCLLTHPVILINNILICTGKVKEYSRNKVVGRISYGILI